MLAPLIYGIYYPQPYLTQILRKVPIAVVDNDLSELSRGIVQTLMPAARSEWRCAPRRWPRRARRSTAARPLRSSAFHPGRSATCSRATPRTFPIYADATYLFIFRTMASGIAVAINTLSSELAAGGARTDGSLVKAALASASPADILLQPIFNPVGGYASYIVPAAFVLILQQIAADRRGDADRRGAGTGRAAEHSPACSAAASRI